jgi:XisH protein
MKSDRIIYLAVPVKTYEDFFTTPFIKKVINRSQINVIIFDPITEEILQWQS